MRIKITVSCYFGGGPVAVMKMRKCPTCIGIGYCPEGDACPTCEGTGEVPTEEAIIDEPCQPGYA
ncbi:MAG: hypothetical protein ABI383_16465 [Acidobacteriaceae bacterium]